MTTDVRLVALGQRTDELIAICNRHALAGLWFICPANPSEPATAARFEGVDYNDPRSQVGVNSDWWTPERRVTFGGQARTDFDRGMQAVRDAARIAGVLGHFSLILCDLWAAHQRFVEDAFFPPPLYGSDEVPSGHEYEWQLHRFVTLACDMELGAEDHRDDRRADRGIRLRLAGKTWGEVKKTLREEAAQNHWNALSDTNSVRRDVTRRASELGIDLKR